MNHLDLFSGIGGFSLAARWAGIETIAFCEKDKFCQKVLAKHWPNVPIYPDVKELIFTDKIDLMTAGFPCQPFSVAGNRKGVKDDRYLWPEVIRIIRECKPTWLLLENVPGIIPMLDPILTDLEEQGYEWRAYLVPASSIQAPHKRERIWIVANANGSRRDSGISHWKERQFQDDFQQHIKKIQQEWSQFIPQSWATFNAQEWLGLTTNANSEQCSEEPEDQKSISIRSKRTQFVGKIRETIGNSNRITSDKTDSDSIAKTSNESRPKYQRTNGYNESQSYWQESEPPIPGVDDGLSARFHQEGNGMDKYLAIKTAFEQGRIWADKETGKIYSLTQRGRKGEKIELMGSNLNGYKVHKLYINGSKYMIRAHQIMWFIHEGKIPQGLCIDHINRDKQDNRLSNLRLVTYQENSINKEPMKPVKLEESWPTEFRELYENGYTGREIAELYGLGKSTIYNCLKQNHTIVDRNRALGNAIVPQVAYSFMRIIKLLHDNYSHE
jgi:DNA-cytosine methyltransferase